MRKWLPGSWPSQDARRHWTAESRTQLESAFVSRAADFGNIVTALMVIGWSVGGFRLRHLRRPSGAG